MREPDLVTVPCSDGAPDCRVRHWSAVGTAKASIIVLHGIQSHGGWYVESSRQLSERGYAVWLPDRRGSGLNPDHRGDAPSFRALLDDIAILVEGTPRPRVLAGISWGGKLAAALERRAPGLIDGLILIAPGIAERVGYSVLQRLRILTARLVRPTRRFALPLGDPQLFTANPIRQQFIRDDSLALREATARLLMESRRLDYYLRWAMSEVKVSVLLLLAECDRIIDNARTRLLMNRFSNADVEIREYAQAHHTLEFEPGGPPFVDDVANWIQARVVAR